MDTRYEGFCLADPLFYDTPARWESDGNGFNVPWRPFPPGWQRIQQGIWTSMSPVGRSVPDQGWKVHISAVPANSWRVLGVVWEYCTDRGIAFKFLRNEKILVARSAKYAPRESSGKFITIYPADEKQLEQILVDLSLTLVGEQGPYILSDLRYESGPLYVRYGRFTEQWTVTADGTSRLALQRPDGVLVPDERGPVFSVPSWVRIPGVLHSQLARRESQSGAEYPYQVDRALHFSNGGGVYLAHPADGGPSVVLKEARPFAGLDWEGKDAVGRLHQEKRTLEALAGVQGVPELYDFITMWEHDFLVMQYMPGRTLSRWLADEYPCGRHDAEFSDLLSYTEKALELVDRIEKLLTAVHNRGVVFGDLHPGNVLVDHDGSVALVDFELSFTDRKPWFRSALGVPGFAAPADRAGFDVDRYSFAALRLWMFLPLVTLAALSPGKLKTHLRFVGARFPVPRDYVDGILAELDPGATVDGVVEPMYNAAPPPAAQDSADQSTRQWFDQSAYYWKAVRKSVVDAITLSATPHRDDRLFPGDIEQFSVGGTCFAYGAAGVLYALMVSGGERHPDYEKWLSDAVHREPPRRPGFYDGAHGVAYVLDQLDHYQQAVDLIDSSVPMTEQISDHGLYGGLAGIGLNLLHLGRRRSHPPHLARAMAIADRIVLAMETAPRVGRHVRTGLLRGWSGPALFFLRLYEHSTDRAWLLLAERALLRDLDALTLASGGARRRAKPHLGTGSAGIALVLEQLVAYVPDAECAAALPELWQECRAEFVPQAGLLSGRAGLLGALATSLRHREDPVAERALRRHLGLLVTLHGVSYLDGLAFPGNHMLRLSMDFATGNAGVLCALAVALGNRDALLPFL
jgi:predicted Ser/Thr protein kinase